MSGINFNLLDLTLETVQKLESGKKAGKWAQGTWCTGEPAKSQKIKGEGETYVPIKVNCGTAMCFAGWAISLGGGRLVIPADSVDDVDADGVTFAEEAWHPDYGVGYVSEVAQYLLGIDDDDADAMFEAYNEMEDLEKHVVNLHEYGNAAGYEDEFDD